MQCKYCQAETNNSNVFCDKCVADTLRGGPAPNRSSARSGANETMIVLISFVCTRFFFDVIYTTINHLIRGQLIDYMNVSGVYSVLSILRVLVNITIVVWLCRKTDKQWLKIVAIFWLIYCSSASIFYLMKDFF